jgi:hypothetical protein
MAGLAITAGYIPQRPFDDTVEQVGTLRQRWHWTVFGLAELRPDPA